MDPCVVRPICLRPRTRGLHTSRERAWINFNGSDPILAVRFVERHHAAQNQSSKSRRLFTFSANKKRDRRDFVTIGFVNGSTVRGACAGRSEERQRRSE